MGMLKYNDSFFDIGEAELIHYELWYQGRGVMCMPGVTKEQIARAKEWDLLSYLRIHEPQELKRCGGNEYCTVSHDSLKISNGRWHWHSQGIGGRTALDYLIKVQGMEFVPAVEALCGGYGRAVSGRPDAEMVEVKKKHLVLPERNRYGTAAVSYLQRRGIDGDIISHCIGEGLLYESRRYQNCVFLGKDTAGEIRYAFLRGIHGQFAGDAEGSDKRYGFALLSADRESPFLAVAESPIDALSLATLSKMQGKDWAGKHYLSLGGTSPCALVQFLEDHRTVAYISLCLDNDKAGLAGMERICRAIRESPALFGRVREIRECPPPVSCGKDYNDLLQEKRAGEIRRSDAAWQL